MGWLWAQRGFGAGTALFALILQLALSFGHVHVLHAGRPHAVAGAVSDGGSAPPASQHPDDDHDSRDCAICSILALLAGARTATAPELSTPTASTVAEVPREAAALRLATRHASFRSRAPPLS